jgi:hypothetical protein
MGGVDDSLNRIINHGQDWVMPVDPSYYLAHNVNLSDGFSFILRISYARYK